MTVYHPWWNGNGHLRTMDSSKFTSKERPTKERAPSWRTGYRIGSVSGGVPPSGTDTRFQSRRQNQYLSRCNEEKKEVVQNSEEVKLREDKV